MSDDFFQRNQQQVEKILTITLVNFLGIKHSRLRNAFNKTPWLK